MLKTNVNKLVKRRICLQGILNNYGNLKTQNNFLTLKLSTPVIVRGGVINR